MILKTLSDKSLIDLPWKTYTEYLREVAIVFPTPVGQAKSIKWLGMPAPVLSP